MPYLSETTGKKKNEYLKSQEGVFLPITLAAGVVTADADGNKIIIPGTVLAIIASGSDAGKYGPYSSTATDGRQTLTNIKCVLDTYSNLKDSDLEVGGCYEGHVIESRVTSNGTLGSVASNVKSALRSVTSDIHFH